MIRDCFDDMIDPGCDPEREFQINSHALFEHDS